MINAVIIEDEPLHLENIEKKIKDHTPEVNIIASLTSGEEALQMLPKIKIDLLFLDIELGDMTAFDLLEKLSIHNFSIIFVTAFNKYAIKAFKINAIDYLLKPVESNELQAAVHKACRNLFSHESKIDLLTDYQLHKTNKLLINEREGLTFIPLDNIYYFKSEGNYTDIHYQDNDSIIKMLVCKTLKYFENKLSGFNFLRISQSVLINANKIKKLKRNKNDVILISGDSFNIAKRRKTEIIEHLKRLSI